jgi:hypothetical protein
MVMPSRESSNIGFVGASLALIVSVLGLCVGGSALVHHTFLTTGGVPPAAYMSPSQLIIGSLIGLSIGIILLARSIRRRR